MPHPIASDEDWLAARLELLRKEKEFTRLRDELTRERLQLPWRRVEKEYAFSGPGGVESLADLFGESSQLLVYHFMFDPQWDEGCKVCTMLADHYDPLVAHLAARDVKLVTVSRAPLLKLEAYRNKMRWSFKWVSSLGSDFNRDFNVTLDPQELAEGRAYYNYRIGAQFPVTEAPGVSAFARNQAGEVFHAYSAYGRGLENLLGIYNFLDISPRGRDEDGLPYPMAWVRRRHEYGDDAVVDPYVATADVTDD